MIEDEYSVLYNYYAGKKESKLKTDIRNEKNQFKRKLLDQVYQELKRSGAFVKR